jgi:hypothetical protein
MMWGNKKNYLGLIKTLFGRYDKVRWGDKSFI